jgi:hypothetical protein
MGLENSGYVKIEQAREQAQEEREKAREAREKLESEARVAESKERLKQIAAETQEVEARISQGAETHQQGMMLMAALLPLLEELKSFGKAARAHYEFENPTCIKASACCLISEAAQKVGTPEALAAAAERLLEIAGIPVPAKPNGKAKGPELHTIIHTD